jgi:hypothetical protein
MKKIQLKALATKIHGLAVGKVLGDVAGARPGCSSEPSEMVPEAGREVSHYHSSSKRAAISRAP